MVWPLVKERIWMYKVFISLSCFHCWAHVLQFNFLLGSDFPAAGDDDSDGLAELTDWVEDPTHLTPLHYASALGKRRYLTLLLKQLKQGVFGERSMARLDNMKETTMMRTTNVSKMTGQPAFMSPQYCMITKFLAFPVTCAACMLYISGTCMHSGNTNVTCMYVAPELRTSRHWSSTSP